MELIVIKEFVNNFIIEEKKERISFEIKSKNKKQIAIDRFSHNVEKIIKKDSIVFKLNSINENEFVKFWKSKELFVLSFKNLNALKLDVFNAFEYIINEYSPVIIFNNNSAIIKTECENGSYYYFLKNK